MGTYNVIPRSEATWGSPFVQYEIATSGIALLAFDVGMYEIAEMTDLPAATVCRILQKVS